MNTPENNNESPFHEGEISIQQKLGVAQAMDRFGRRVIRDYMPDQHREFFENLSYIVLGGVDDQDRPWASFLMSESGFVSSPDPKTLVINEGLQEGDPLKEQLHKGSDLGLLGIDLATRRRNRLSTVIQDSTQHQMTLSVKQSFGNCPKFISVRQIGESNLHPKTLEISRQDLKEEMRRIISDADTFFIASGYQGAKESPSSGADVSHRGGQPGFVEIEGNQLIFPDYRGNNHFNTLGNLIKNPKAGLTFLDFKNSSILYLTGQAFIDFELNSIYASQGAERVIRFRCEEARLLRHWLRKGFVEAGIRNPKSN